MINPFFHVQEHLKLLWTWVIICLVSSGLGLIHGIVEGTQGNGLRAAAEFLSAAITACFICCVHMRIKDIRLSQQATAAYEGDELDSVPDV